MTPRRTLSIGLPATLLGGLLAGHLTLPDAPPAVAASVIAPRTAPTPAPPVDSPVFTIDAFEDGSGYLRRDGIEVHQFDADFLPWDCTAAGNMVCGPTAPASVRGFRCIEFVYAPDDVNIGYCTDGSMAWGPADDVDAEGEVID